MKRAGTWARRGLVPGLCAVALIVTSTACARHVTGTKWEITWQDEFDGTAGQLPDASRWGFDVGTGWGNAQLEYDTDHRPENVSLDGQGHLAITARQESWLGQDYTSGRINTQSHFEQATGRFEARMRLPRGQGMWPAFWLLGSNYASVPWPSCGEIDIMEYRGQEPGTVHGSLHGPGYSGATAITHSYTSSGGTLDTTWHVYAVEWTSSLITWYVDDLAYFAVSPKDLPGGAGWAFDHPFFIILDLAVGGTFVGPPDSTTAFPQQLLVDYVRVYRKR